MPKPASGWDRSGSRAAAAAATGLLYAAAQPGVGAWPLAAICLVPLLLALRGARPVLRAVLGWLAGTIATSLATVAGTAGAASYFGLSRPVAAIAAVAVAQVFGAGSFAFFAVAAGDPSRRSPLRAGCTAAGAFAVAELARVSLFTGFPWLLLSYALLPVPALAQLASITGAIGVSLILALANAGLAELAAARRASTRRRASCVSAFAFAALAAGVFLPAGGGSVAPAAGERMPGAVRIALVQHAPPRERRATPGSARREAERLAALTRSAGDFDLAVWSENAVGALLPENLHLLRGALPPGADRALLVGAGYASADGGGRRTSAFLVGGDGSPLGRHDKVKLLPFAEYAPWPLTAGQLGIAAVAAGPEPRVVRWRETALGPLVCYEVLFAGLARSLARGGAGVLVNLSNDTWFGATGAAEQHLAAGMYRAIETRRPLVRATHTGITAGIDARGRVAARLPRDVPAILVLDVRPGSAIPPYARLGDAPVWILAAAALAAGVKRGRCWG